MMKTQKVWVGSNRETTVLNNRQGKFLALCYIFCSSSDAWDFPKPFTHFIVGKISLWQLPVIPFCQRLHLCKTVCQLQCLAVLGGCPDHHLQISTEDISPLSAQQNCIHWDNFVHRSLEHLYSLKFDFSCSASQSALPNFSSVWVLG